MCFGNFNAANHNVYHIDTMFERIILKFAASIKRDMLY